MRHFRPEIQALRALAVAVVVVFHLWPNGPLRGGFVGVDVFFVISGFLITGHLVRDLGKPTGRYLADFWTRRAIRILPASLVMLVLVGLVGGLVLPSLHQRAHWTELLASTLYVENLQLIRARSDYLTANDSPSAFQHAWSLSIEEQFYLLWPLVILVLSAVAVRFTRPGRRWRVLATALVLVIVASAVWSAIDTGQEPSRAYFSTFTRMHEFALGGLLAVLGARVALPSALARVARWLGILVIVASAVLLRAPDFPGLLALIPCLAAVAVIAAGEEVGERSRDPLWRTVISRPVQWVGDASYSIYLWHWPLIVLLPYFGLGDAGAVVPVLALALTLAFAAWSRHYVELPTQRSLRGIQPVFVAAVMGTAMTMAVLVGGGGLFVSHSLAANQERLAGGPCVGAEASANRERCGDPFTGRATFEVGPKDVYNAQFEQDCVQREPYCWPKGKPVRRVVALVGDSHAVALYPALAEAAAARDWSVAVFVRAHCAPTNAPFERISGNKAAYAACVEFRDQTKRQLAELKPDLIVSTGLTGQVEYASGADPVHGFTSLWQEWMRIAPVVFVRDNPLPLQDDAGRCVNPRSAVSQAACTVPRDQALPPGDPLLAAAAREVSSPRFQLVDLSHLYCGETECYPVVGGVPVYYDRNHINSAFAQTLGGPLGVGITWPDAATK